MGKIMMIDDDLDTLEIYKKYLGTEHRVFTYESGTSAIDSVKGIVPDLILLDIEMPFMDGFKTMEILRGMRGCEETPIIGLTGQNDKATFLKFIAKGGSGYITKPVTKDQLVQKVNEAIKIEEERRSKKKILIVDDELESLLIYKNILQKQYNVVPLNSAKLALEYLLKYTPDLIILDYYMPLYNGKALYQMISKMEHLENIPILFLTGTKENEAIIECASLNPAGIIHKSAGSELLLKRIAEVFAERGEDL